MWPSSVPEVNKRQKIMTLSGMSHQIILGLRPPITIQMQLRDNGQVDLSCQLVQRGRVTFQRQVPRRELAKWTT